MKSLIAFNALIWMVARFSEYILLFILGIAAANVFGVEDFGTLRTAMIFITIWVILTDFGLYRLLVREISRNRDNLWIYHSTGLSIKIFLLLFSGLVLIPCFFLYTSSPLVQKLLLIYGLALTLNSFIMFYQAFFQAFDKLYIMGGIRIFGVVFLCAAGGIILWKTPKLDYYLYCYLFSYLIGLLVTLVFFLKTFGNWKWIFDIGIFKNLLKQLIPFGFFALFASFYLYIDTLLLKQLLGSTEVGIYQAAFRLMICLMFIPESLGNAIFPTLASSFRQSIEALTGHCRKAEWAVVVLAFPICAGMFMLAGPIIELVYKEEYLGAVPLLQISAIVILFRFLGSIPSNVITATDRQGLRVYLVITASILSVIGNYLLIPQFGVKGAALAAVLTNGFLAGMNLYLGFGYLKRPIGWLTMLWKPVLSTLLMAIVVYLTRNTSIFITIPLGAMVYFSILILLDKQFSHPIFNLEIMWSMLKKKK